MPVVAWALHSEPSSTLGVWSRIHVSPELTRTAFLRTYEMEQQGNYPSPCCPEHQVQGQGAQGPRVLCLSIGLLLCDAQVSALLHFSSSPLPVLFVLPLSTSLHRLHLIPLLSISFFTLNAQRRNGGFSIEKRMLITSFTKFPM